MMANGLQEEASYSSIGISLVILLVALIGLGKANFFCFHVMGPCISGSPT